MPTLCPTTFWAKLDFPREHHIQLQSRNKCCGFVFSITSHLIAKGNKPFCLHLHHNVIPIRTSSGEEGGYMSARLLVFVLAFVILLLESSQVISTFADRLPIVRLNRCLE